MAWRYITFYFVARCQWIKPTGVEAQIVAPFIEYQIWSMHWKYARTKPSGIKVTKFAKQMQHVSAIIIIDKIKLAKRAALERDRPIQFAR